MHEQLPQDVMELIISYYELPLSILASPILYEKQSIESKSAMRTFKNVFKKKTKEKNKDPFLANLFGYYGSDESRTIFRVFPHIDASTMLLTANDINKLKQFISPFATAIHVNLSADALISFTEFDLSKVIRNNKHIRKLDLRYRFVKDLSSLAGCNSLEYLDIRFTKAEKAGSVTPLLTNLQTLLTTSIEASNVPASVTKLHVTTTTFTETDTNAFENLKSLRSLHLGPSKLEKFSFLESCTSLNELYIGSCDANEGSMKHVAKLEALKRITLYGVSLRDQDMADILCGKPRNKLEYLSVSYAKLETSFTHLSNLINLNTLELMFVPPSYDVAVFESLTSLRRLVVNKCSISDQFGIELLDSIKGNVTCLHMESNRLTGDFVKHLVTYNIHLTELSISGNKQLGESIELLSTHPSLRVLSIADVGLESQQVPKLLESQQITYLDLSLNNFENDTTVLNGLCNNTTLQELNLNKTRIADDHLQPILENKTLRKLDVSSCNITDVGAKLLFTKNTGLQTLVLRSNKLTKACMQAGPQSKLEQIDVSHSNGPTPLTAGDIVDIQMQDLRFYALC
jgi:hypothetical protein